LRANPGRNAFGEALVLEESVRGAFAPAPSTPGSETGQLPDDLL
jgi:hypothetical protein